MLLGLADPAVANAQDQSMCAAVQTGRDFSWQSVAVMPVFDAFDGAQNTAGSPSVQRVHWQVKECLVCSWHDLAEPYSLDQMWRFLQQGRYSHAHPVEEAGGAVAP
jgi:hypothetical protein